MNTSLNSNCRGEGGRGGRIEGEGEGGKEERRGGERDGGKEGRCGGWREREMVTSDGLLGAVSHMT